MVFVQGQVTKTMSVAFGMARNGTTMPRLGDEGGAPLLIARSPAQDIGVRRQDAMAMMLRQFFGRLGLTMSAERGQAARSGRRSLNGRGGYSLIEAGIDRPVGPARLGLSFGLMDEDATVFGSRFSPGLANGARTRFLTASADVTVARGWSLGLLMRQSVTQARAGVLVAGGRLRGSAYAVSLTGAGVFARNDRIGLRIVQPLRVDAGGLNLLLPDDYDYATEVVGRSVRHLGLAPKGREIDAELGWQIAWEHGWLATSAFVRHEPGNIAGAPLDPGGTLRLGVRW
jgi:hypothetical protein